MSEPTLSGNEEVTSSETAEQSQPEQETSKKSGKKKLSFLSRGLMIAAAALLAASAFLPWWGLLLTAPQYPEGLQIIVYPDKLGPEDDIYKMNILNHYIGMEEISEDGFPELQYITYIIWAMVALLVVVALVGNKKLAYLVFGLFIIGAAVGVYDMYHWLQTFGTQLDPAAPITIQPFVPPIIGQNQLANFTTYSSFRVGFYFLAASGLALALAIFGDKLWSRKSA